MISSIKYSQYLSHCHSHFEEKQHLFDRFQHCNTTLLSNQVLHMYTPTSHPSGPAALRNRNMLKSSENDGCSRLYIYTATVSSVTECDELPAIVTLPGVASTWLEREPVVRAVLVGVFGDEAVDGATCVVLDEDAGHDYNLYTVMSTWLSFYR
jgi:hypothetical protein